MVSAVVLDERLLGYGGVSRVPSDASRCQAALNAGAVCRKTAQTVQSGVSSTGLLLCLGSGMGLGPAGRTGTAQAKPLQPAREIRFGYAQGPHTPPTFGMLAVKRNNRNKFL